MQDSDACFKMSFNVLSNIYNWDIYHFYTNAFYEQHKTLDVNNELTSLYSFCHTFGCYSFWNGELSYDTLNMKLKVNFTSIKAIYGSCYL